MPAGTRIADYLDAIGYRRYSRSLVLERRRLLGLAAQCGDDDWLCTAPTETVIATVRARCQLRSRTGVQKLSAALDDYRRWRRRQEAGDDE